MLTDVEIAQSAEMKPIVEIAQKVGLDEDDLELYGKYKAKISLEAIKKLDQNEDGKLILVTAINPTPAGEGKTTTMIGLSQALNKLGKKSVVAMREPSLGPCFGTKVELLVEDMRKLFQWKISTFILQEIFMQSLLQTT